MRLKFCEIQKHTTFAYYSFLEMEASLRCWTDTKTCFVKFQQKKNLMKKFEIFIFRDGSIFEVLDRYQDMFQQISHVSSNFSKKKFFDDEKVRKIIFRDGSIFEMMDRYQNMFHSNFFHRKKIRDRSICEMSDRYQHMFQQK